MSNECKFQWSVLRQIEKRMLGPHRLLIRPLELPRKLHIQRSKCKSPASSPSSRIENALEVSNLPSYHSPRDILQARGKFPMGKPLKSFQSVLLAQVMVPEEKKVRWAAYDINKKSDTNTPLCGLILNPPVLKLPIDDRSLPF